MENWVLRKNGWNSGDAASDGNRFLCANGYMGLRGTPEEAGKSRFAAVSLAGVYDRYEDRWREPVNAPYPLSVQLCFDGRALLPEDPETVKHETEIDYRDGIFRRDTDFGPAELHTERFASMAEYHLLADRMKIRVRKSGMLEIRAGISSEIWDINGPHLSDFQFRTGKVLLCRAVTGEKGIIVAAAQCAATDFCAEEAFEKAAGAYSGSGGEKFRKEIC